MKVRFVLPDHKNDGDHLFDRTVSLSDVPLPGEDVGVADKTFPGMARLVEVSRRRWYVDEEEPVVEVWLSDDSRSRRHNLYVNQGCRFGMEREMEEIRRFQK